MHLEVLRYSQREGAKWKYQNPRVVIPYQAYKNIEIIVIRTNQYIVMHALSGVIYYHDATECLPCCYGVPNITRLYNMHTTQNPY